MYKSKKSNSALIIGLTGNIGSGKSLALKKLKRDGFFTISADEVVKKAYSEKGEFYDGVVNLFGTIDSKIILENEALWDELDDLTKKFIVPKIFDLIDDNLNKVKFIVVEIPLLFEFDLDACFDVLVLVTSSVERFNKTYQKIKNRQICDANKIATCDFVVYNNMSKASFLKKIDYLEKKLKAYV